MVRETVLKIDDSRDVIHGGITTCSQLTFPSITGEVINSSLVDIAYRDRFDDKNYYRGLRTLSQVGDFDTDISIIEGMSGIGFTSTNPPSIVISGLNSYNTMLFDGTNDYLSASDFLNTSDVSAVCVFKLNGSGSTDTSYLTTNTAFELYYDKSTAKLTYSSDSGNTTIATNNPISTGLWYIAGVSRASDGEANLYISNPVTELVGSTTPIAETFWLKCDDNAASVDVIDSSVNAVVGTGSVNTADMSISSGIVGNAFRFNNTARNIDFGDVSDLNFSTTDSFTVSFWSRRLGVLAGDGYILDKHNGAGEGWSIFSTFHTGDVYFITDGDISDPFLGVASVQYVWRLITLVYDNGNVSLYKDGVFVETKSITSITPTSQTVRLGASVVFADNLNDVDLDDIRVYSTALTTDQIALIYNAGNGTSDSIEVGSVGSYSTEQVPNSKGYDILSRAGDYAEVGTPALGMTGPAIETLWIKCDDNAGNTNVLDYSASGVTGTASADTNTLSVAGKVGTALAFGSSVTTVDFGNLTDLNFETADSFSVSFWVKHDGVGSYGPILDKHNGITEGWSMYIDWTGNKKLYTIFDGDTSDPFTPLSIGSDWVLMTVVYSAGSVSLYINGEFLETKTGFTITGSSQDVRMGVSAFGADTLRTHVDDVRVYSVALTQSQIDQIYNDGSGTDAPLRSVGITTVGGTSSANFMDGEIAEFITYDQFLNDNDMLAIFRNLNTKYNI